MRPPIENGVMKYRDADNNIIREVCAKTPAGKREYKRRTEEMASRQWNNCAWCHHPMMMPSFDHAGGRGSGGSRRDDRILDEHGHWMNAALCSGPCQGLKGSRRYEWRGGKYVPVEKYRKAAIA